MFTPQLRVQYKTAPKLDMTVEDSIKICEEMDNATKTQAALGLGDPIKSSYSTKALLLQQIQLQKLIKDFKLIKKPKVATFSAFRYSEPDVALLVDGTLHFVDWFLRNHPPKIAMVKLGKETQTLRYEHNCSHEYNASIPAIPSSVQALASKAKQTAPDIQFYLLFMPQWERGMQLDPYLLGYLPGVDEWVEIGWWGGDKDLIKHLVKEK